MKKMKLFLAEDDIDDVEIFSDIILSISPDTEISVSKNGILFMNLLRDATELPEFIFLDLNMPLKNGFECLREIKNSDKWKNIKTVILSTTNQPEQIKSVYEMGADLYLAKPTSYSAFKNSLFKCLEMDWATLK